MLFHGSRILSIGLLVMAFPMTVVGQEPKMVELTITPQAAPSQALRYRLLPLESKRTPGDAVPIYLRMTSETKDEAMREAEKARNYLDGPLSDFPVAEAKELLGKFSHRLQQMEFAARRKTAEWNYTLPEQSEEIMHLLLPDAQEIRVWARLVPLKARLEVAEHKYEEAIRTIETGLAMGRHIAEGPFLISALVGIAVANDSLNRLDELVSQPDAPNLYWALSALPRPLVSVRKGMETEQTMLENMLPEITDLESVETEAEWASRLRRLHRRWNSLAEVVGVELATIQPPGAAPNAQPGAKSVMTVSTDVAKFAAATLPEAKSFLQSQGVKLEGMSDAEIIVRYIAYRHREIRDQNFKATYLPYPQAVLLYEAQNSEPKEAGGPVLALLTGFEPALGAGHRAEAQLDRRVAALRVIEALRMHLAADGATLPKTLDEIKIVPIPNDPMTGKAFEYRLDGDQAVLTLPSKPAMVYKIKVAK